MIGGYPELVFLTLDSLFEKGKKEHVLEGCKINVASEMNDCLREAGNQDQNKIVKKDL